MAVESVSERDIERRLVQGVKAMGGKAYKFLSPGNSGVPDRLIILPGGTVIFAELKTENGQLSAVQRSQITELERLGTSVRVVKGEAGVGEFLAACRKEVKA